VLFNVKVLITFLINKKTNRYLVNEKIFDLVSGISVEVEKPYKNEVIFVQPNAIAIGYKFLFPLDTFIGLEVNDKDKFYQDFNKLIKEVKLKDLEDLIFSNEKNFSKESLFDSVKTNSFVKLSEVFEFKAQLVEGKIILCYKLDKISDFEEFKIIKEGITLGFMV